jgi:hypothetical protein
MIANILSGVTANTTSPAKGTDHLDANRAYQAVVTGVGALTAVVKVQGSLDGTFWKDLITFNLNGNNAVGDAQALAGFWPLVRGDVSGLSGTNAAVTLTMAGKKQ